MRSTLAALALLLACSGPPSSAPSATPSTTPAPEPAVPLEDPRATQPARAEPEPAPAKPTPAEEDNGGFADPKTAADEPPRTAPKPPADPALAARIKERFGERCTHERSCGDLLGIDCQSAADGPYYYVQRRDLKTVATCGGACMTGQCTDCPPKAWTCPTY